MRAGFDVSNQKTCRPFAIQAEGAVFYESKPDCGNAIADWMSDPVAVFRLLDILFEQLLRSVGNDHMIDEDTSVLDLFYPC